jgi:hypothetical protein
LWFFIIKDDVIHACLSCNIVGIQKQPMGFASLIKETPGKSTPVIDFTHCNNRAILCSGINDVDYISKKVLTLLTGKLEHV